MSATVDSYPTPGANNISIEDVPHHWQLSERWGLAPEARRKICSLVCMKIVLDFKLAKDGQASDLPLDQITDMMIANGGKTENGWKHTAEVSTFGQLGINSWRRDWNHLATTPEEFAAAERYGKQQLAALQAQQQAEIGFSRPTDKAKACILLSLSQANPVIASVQPGFSENRGPHQVVIHGYQNGPEGESIFISDPIIEDAAHQVRPEPWERFCEYFNKRAIFVQ